MELFQLKTKTKQHPLVEEIITFDASKKGYGGFINKLSFRDKLPGKMGWETYINIFKLDPPHFRKITQQQ